MLTLTSMLRPLLVLSSVLSSVLAVLLATATSFAAISVSNIRREGTTRVFAQTPFDKDNGNSGFNRADCFDPNQIVKIFVSSIPADADHVELWVRLNEQTCANTLNWPAENGGTDPQCGRVKQWTRPVANNADITFKPIEVIYAIRNRQHADGADGKGRTLDPNTVCTDTSGATPTAFYFQMMAFKGDRVLGYSGGGSTTAGEVIGFQSSFDISGPTAPTDPSLKAGNGALFSTFTSGATTGTTAAGDLVGYRAYCFPTGSRTAGDGGVGTSTAALEAGDDAADAATEDVAADTEPIVEDTGTPAPAIDGGVDSKCSGSIPFVAGEIPTPEHDKYICLDDKGTTSGKLTITGLTNYTTYAVAITASDRHGNPGPFSPVRCETPRPTKDFYSLYRKGGGGAGGGYCAMIAPAAPMGVFGVSLVFALLVRVARRRPR